VPDVKIGIWLLTEDDRHPSRYLLYREQRGEWVFVRYLKVLKG
jgi:hypothetical protein